MQTRRLAIEPDDIAPDGSQVRFLARTPNASMAEFRLSPGVTTHAVVHQTVDEVWFVTAGMGQLWRHAPDRDSTVDLNIGVSVSIERGTAFQFRNTGTDDLAIVGVTTPPWPGPGEAAFVTGRWDRDR